MANTIITALATVICAALGALVTVDTRKRKGQYAKTEARAERRAGESRLSMRMMSAVVEQCEAISIAVAGGEINGEMERARESARKAREEYTAFLEGVAAEELAK
ncbi:MAG: hypothetical protein LBJ84_05395 [Oscillospiraceae bacterium]|jgi:hypothetical protein|nr:hypothetical protein [Oscillospiraceae bacterium]